LTDRARALFMQSTLIFTVGGLLLALARTDPVCTTVSNAQYRNVPTNDIRSVEDLFLNQMSDGVFNPKLSPYQRVLNNLRIYNAMDAQCSVPGTIEAFLTGTVFRVGLISMLPSVATSGVKYRRYIFGM